MELGFLHDPSGLLRHLSRALCIPLDGTLSLLQRAMRCNYPRLPYCLLGGYLGGSLPAIFQPDLAFDWADPAALAPEGRPAFDAPPPEGDTCRPRASRCIAPRPASRRAPGGGAVRPKAVTVTIDDGVKPLVAVEPSDGSIEATPSHAFFVESGPGLMRATWVQAGDRLRTADGKVVWVVGLRYHAGYAHVYTLTVATDPSTRLRGFFVGSARVLVHNADALSCAKAAAQAEAERLRVKGWPGGVVGAYYDATTGKIHRGHNDHRTPVDQLDPTMRWRVEARRLDPAHTNTANPDPINCAEVQACSLVMLDTADPRKGVLYSIYISDGSPAPRCLNCQVTTYDVGSVPSGDRPQPPRRRRR